MSPAARAGIGIAVLLSLTLIVANAYGDYRAAKAEIAETQIPIGAAPGTAPEAKSAGKKASAKKKAAEKKQIVIVRIDGLNFRSKPDSNAERIDALKEGQELVVISKADGWYKARDAQGHEGYVSANPQYTKLETK